MKLELLDGQRAVILELITLRSNPQGSNPQDGVNLTTSRVVAKVIDDLAIIDLNVQTAKDAKRSDDFETDLDSLNWIFDELTSRLKQNMMPATRSVYIVSLYDQLRVLTEDENAKRDAEDKKRADKKKAAKKRGSDADIDSDEN